MDTQTIDTQAASRLRFAELLNRQTPGFDYVLQGTNDEFPIGQSSAWETLVVGPVDWDSAVDQSRARSDQYRALRIIPVGSVPVDELFFGQG